MQAVKTHVGRCMVPQEGKQCGKPAAYAQLLGAGRQFLFCEEHASNAIKKAAEVAAKRSQ